MIINRLKDSLAYKEGYEEGEKNPEYLYEECPYPSNTLEHEAWCNGRHAAISFYRSATNKNNPTNWGTILFWVFIFIIAFPFSLLALIGMGIMHYTDD